MNESFEDPTGRPQPRTRLGRGRTAGAAALLLVVAAAGATGVAAAADGTESPSPSPGTSPPSGGESGAAKPRAEGKAGGWKGHHGGRHGAGGIGMGALHGEFVTPKAGGGYETVAVQRGEVTAVSTESLSVKSADGFTRTYAVTADTRVHAARDGIDSVKAGHQVHVVAVVEGSTATLRRVGDLEFRPERPGKGPKPAAPGSTAPEGTQTTPSGFSGAA